MVSRLPSLEQDILQRHKVADLSFDVNKQAANIIIKILYKYLVY